MSWLLSTMALSLRLMFENWREMVLELVSRDPNSAQGVWQKVAQGLPALGFLLGLVLVVRVVLSIRSRSRAAEEQQLAQDLVAQVQRKCHLIDLVIEAQETHANLQSTLESNRVKSTLESNRVILVEAYSNVVRASSNLLRDIESVAKELKAQRDSEVRLDEEVNMHPTIRSLLKVLALTGIPEHQAACSSEAPTYGPVV